MTLCCLYAPLYAIEMCGILFLQVMMTFADHLNLLYFLVKSQCTKVTVMASFNAHSISSQVVYMYSMYS